MNNFQVCKFIRGLQTNYVTGGSGSAYTVIDSFKTSYPDWQNIVYFATDTQTLWMSGSAYGISGQSLQFMSTVVTSAVKEGNTLTLTTYDSTKAEGSRTGTIVVPLTTIVEDVSSAIKITAPVGDSTDYIIGLTVDGKTISQSAAEGLKTTLTLGKSTDGKSLYLKDSLGNTVGNSVDVSNFLQDSFLSDAELTSVNNVGTPGKYLHLHVTYKDNPTGSTGEDFYINLNEYFNNYTTGNGISVSTTGASPVVSLKLSATWLGFDADGNLVDTSLATKITDLSTHITDISNNINNIIGTANSEVINTLRGTVDSSWQNDVSTTHTIWGVKNYVDSSVTHSLNNIIGTTFDTSLNLTIHGDRAYTDSKIAQFYEADDTSIQAETNTSKSKVFTEISIEDGSFSPTESKTENVGDLHLANFSLADDVAAPDITEATQITNATSINNAIASVLKAMCWIDMDTSV